MGEPIYVEVDANVVDGGIMTLAGTGGAIDGQGGFWLYWSIDAGFQNGAVGWDKLEPYISQTGWPSFATGDNAPKDEFGQNYDTGYTGFYRYLTNVRPSNLDSILGNWSTKSVFINEYMGNLVTNSCFRLVE